MVLIIWGCSKVDFENGLCNIYIYTLHNIITETDHFNKFFVFCMLMQLKIELSTFQDFGIEMC